MSSFGIIPYKPVKAGAVARMKPADAKVYIVICAHASAKTWEARPGVGRMAELAGVTKRAVYGAIIRLEALRLIVVERSGGGRGHTSKYLLTGNSERPFTLSEQVNSEPAFTHSTIKGERARTERVNGRAVHIRNEQVLNRGEAAAPPVVDEKASSNGAAGRVIAAWCEGFKGRTGNAVAQGAKGRLSGTIKRLLGDFDEPTLTTAVTLYFVAGRKTYGPGLFERKLQDGDRDLLPRPEQAPPRDPYSERTLAELKGQRP